MTTLTVNLGADTYPIIIGKGLLCQADKYFNLNRRVLIVTDDGVPHKYAETIERLCKEAILLTVKSGEESKSLATLEKILLTMLEHNFDRSDCIVAVGGGVVGDLAGFASSIYMRGVDFYNVPTTLLSQVDSSIGGKTAVNLGGVKNNIGSFKQPRAVLIDAETLDTLDDRQFSAGLAESVKMSLTSDASLFGLFKTLSFDEVKKNIEEIIVKSLSIKKYVVEQDEKENGLRKILNFGHTFGHCIESNEGMAKLLHGECVALGMLPMCSESIRTELVDILKKFALPHRYSGDINAALSFVSHDKKRHGDTLSVVFVEVPGEYNLKNISTEEFKKIVKNHIF